MIELKNINQLKEFNVYGIKQICGYNRDYIQGYNAMNRDQIEDIFYDCIFKNETILIPDYIYNNIKYIKKI